MDYEDISSSEFFDDYGYSNDISKLSDYSNEIFINYLIKKKEWMALIKSDDELLKTEGSSLSHLLWNDYVEDNFVGESGVKPISNIQCWVKLFAYFIACFIVIFFRKMQNDVKNVPLKKIAIVRSSATYSKLNSIFNDLNITLISEDIVYRNRNMISLFSIISFSQCFKAMRRAYKTTFQDFYNLDLELREHFGAKFSRKLLANYASRVVLKCYFEEILNILVVEHNIEELVTGNKEDRFAMVEKKVCSRYEIPLTCIPHGLEYSYAFPTGVAGDVFYCTSDNAKNVLSDLYPKVDFKFDESIQNEMYKVEGLKKTSSDSKSIVFFTEPRDIEVNRKIIDDLISLEVNFSVRLHPKDCSSNYLDKSISYHDDYESAIKDSICICRKSTVLIEAVYNKSVAISYLINSKDSYYVSRVFPSLSSNNIYKCHDKESLAELILAS
ncbi:hypothetical protein [Vibrio campbellii]|uniref:hypothetical protein n=1 Tax=Vibrio campbellii TaxID=680 RepID=UPI003F84CE00